MRFRHNQILLPPGKARPASGLITLNRDSEQAQGLIFALPLIRDANSITGRNHGAWAIAAAANYSLDAAFFRTAHFFGNVNYYISVPHGTGVAPTDNWTYATWVKRTSTGSRNDPIFSCNAGNPGRNIYCTISQFDNIIIGVPSLGPNHYWASSITDTNWHHIAITRSGSTWKHYFDGKLDNTSTDSTAQEAATVPFRIADDGSNSTAAARMADFRSYSRVLTDGEIAALYNPQSRWGLYRPAGVRTLWIPSNLAAYNLTAATGAFALTGSAATLKKGLSLQAATGAFALTGNAATLKKGLSLTAATGAFALTGNAATLKTARKLTCATGAFALTGNAATLKKGLSLTAATGAFALTGNSATLKVDRKLLSATGAFALTGNAATLKKEVILQGGAGAFAFTGNAATLKKGLSLTAATGAFALTGNAATLKKGLSLTAATGAFVLTGNAATLSRARSLACETGVFALTGNVASLVKSGNYAIIGSKGVFTLTGNAATLKVDRKLTAATGAFALTGNAANLHRGRTLTAEAAAFALTGNAANLRAVRKLTCTAGAFSLTGNAATLTKGSANSLVASTGVFALTGNAAQLRVSRVLPAATGTFTATGQPAALLAARKLLAAPGTFALAGQAVSFLKSYPLLASAGSFMLSGSAATLRASRSLVASTGVFALVGRAASLTYSGALGLEHAPTARTIIVAAQPTIQVSAMTTGHVTFEIFTKDPDAILDFTVDWSAWLTTETITTSTWTVPSGLTNIEDDSDTTTATIRLDGGTLHKTYLVRNHIVTSDGRENTQSFKIRVEKQ